MVEDNEGGVRVQRIVRATQVFSGNGQRMIETKGGFRGMVFYKHPDGQWVTIRKATDHELNSADLRISLGIQEP